MTTNIGIYTHGGSLLLLIIRDWHYVFVVHERLQSFHYARKPTADRTTINHAYATDRTVKPSHVIAR